MFTTFGTDLSKVTVVFPNKRASLFLNEHLARLSDQPIWSPSYTTISDLFRSLSPREVADPIKLICDLYKSFIACTGIEETLDHFYGWGEILLADFDDVDKHMAPAEKVFANLRDIHEFDDDSYLTEQQREMIRKFFSNFNEDHNTELKQRFLSLWSHIYDIYLDFNARLASQGIAYEGALYREVIENRIFLSKTSWLGVPPVRRSAMPLATGGTQECFSKERSCPILGEYVFVGFNLLHPVEQALIDHLGPRAMVIQDNDEETPKNISIISAPTNNIQARYVSTWLQENNRIEAGSKTAIVLADESLLQSVIHCLPPEVSKVNITTGYPLSQTATASDPSLGDWTRVFLSKTFLHPSCERSKSQTEAKEDRSVLSKNILASLWLQAAKPSAAEEERRARTFLKEWSWPQLPDHDTSSLSPLEAEAQFRLYTILNRLMNLIESGDLQVSDETLQRLLTQIIGSTTIPFHGEPIEGIQIMGVLETRNLDFDHVLLLSCNEGNLPKGINDTSFIPYSLRKAYGLTTIDHKVSIYANYFRRLLQRAQDVTLVYNNATTDGKTGEMSRFMLQMMVEGRHPITYKTLQAGQTPILNRPQPVTKTEAVMQRLQSLDTLSPSALARYLRCPLQFFYRYVAGLEEYEDEDERIDNRLFGNIFHKAAQNLYQKMMNSRSALITAEAIEGFLKTKVDIERAVDEAIKLELFHIEDPMAAMPPLTGLQLINREVIIRYVRQLLEIDRRLAPFTILGLERSIYSDVGQILSITKHSCVPPVASGIAERRTGGTPSQDVFERKDLSSLKIGGIIDRLDKITLPDGSSRIRVVDYKTGSGRLRPLPNIASIFDPANLKNHSDYYLQTILYAIITKDSGFPLRKHSCVPLVASGKAERRTGCNPSQDVFERNITVLPVSPCLLFIQHAGTDDYDPTLLIGNTPVTDINEVKDEFLQHLNTLLTEIFDPDTPFLPTEERTRCKSCPFHSLCGI